MTHLYEGMFLLDNDVVREDWKAAKAQVTDLVAKHGGTVRTARRWDERRLAYPIKGRGRASYLLCHFELPTDGSPGLVRDLELRESVLRHLIVCAEDVPATEVELSDAENAADFVAPPPPADEPVREEPAEEPPRGRESSRSKSEKRGESEASGDGAAEGAAKDGAAKDGAAGETASEPKGESAKTEGADDATKKES